MTKTVAIVAEPAQTMAPVWRVLSYLGKGNLVREVDG